MIFTPQSVSFYKKTRIQVIEHLAPDSIAIFHSNDKMPSTGDQYYPFRQNKDLLRLCGIYQEDTALVLFPDHPDQHKRELLFIRRTDDHIRIWEGTCLDKAQAESVSGVKNIYWFDQFESIVYPLIVRAKNVYLNSNEKAAYPLIIENRNERYGKHLMSQFPFHQFHRLQPILKNLSLVKTKEEIQAIKTAIKLTGDTWKIIDALIKPGMHEYEIAAEISYQFEKQGAIHAFEPIVASGSSACALHYKSNHQILAKDDLILVDFGAELNGYAADMTRCKAIDGTMNKRQFEVYDQVLSVFLNVKQVVKAGLTIAELNDIAEEKMGESLLQLGLVPSSEIAEKQKIKKYFPHGVAHFLGMDVHDYGDRYTEPQPGIIITCEPGIYITEESIGIRLENDLLITTEGCIDLMEEYEL